MPLLAGLLNRQRALPGIRDIEDFHPLLSQPLIETALRIPLPLLLSGGRTRGLARRAFVDYAPTAILNRELKGQTSSYTLSLLRDASKFIAQLLLDGLLLEHRLVRREALVDVLLDDFPIAADTFFPLFACVAAEIWMRSWNSLSVDSLGIPPRRWESTPVISDHSGTQWQRAPKVRAATEHWEEHSRSRAD